MVHRDRLAARRDPGVLEDLYDAHGTICYRLAHRMVADPHLASMVVRDVFVEAWIGNAAFDPARGSVHTWLLAATHRRAVEVIRDNRQSGSQSVGSSTGARRGAVDGEPHAEAAGVGATANLSAAQRQLLELAYFGGHTQPEIAKLTGTALATIKTLTLAALRQLRTDSDARANTTAQDCYGVSGELALP